MDYIRVALYYIAPHCSANPKGTRRQYQLTYKVSRYCPMALHGNTVYSTINLTKYNAILICISYYFSDVLQLKTNIDLHCIALHCIALHCIALHCIALHCIALHCIALHCIALHCIALHCIALHCSAFYKLHRVSLHRVTMCSIAHILAHNKMIRIKITL